MKKIILVLVIVFAFGMKANAQDIAMVEVDSVIENYSNELVELKNMLIEELKKSEDWIYDDSEYNKIAIIENSIERYNSIINFIWTFSDDSNERPNYLLVKTYRFHKNNRTGKVKAVSRTDSQLIKK